MGFSGTYLTEEVESRKVADNQLPVPLQSPKVSKHRATRNSPAGRARRWMICARDDSLLARYVYLYIYFPTRVMISEQHEQLLVEDYGDRKLCDHSTN